MQAVSDQPKQYMLVLQMTGFAELIFSAPKTYEECAKDINEIGNRLSHGITPLEGCKYGFGDLLINTQHIVSVGMQLCLS